ncbi:MAG: peptidoglycan-binding protein [Candidatus Sumerlaeaceae bacterium]
MLNPVKLFLLTTGAVVVLAVAPYVAGKLVSEHHDRGTAAAPLASSDAMTELPSPRPGAPVEALRTRMTEQPEKKTASKSSAAKETELPKPRDSKNKTKSSETAAAKTETKSAADKPTPAATAKPELPYRADVARAQQLLLKLGKFEGKHDGKLGPITQAAITDFQKENALTAKGEPDGATLKKLAAAVADLPTPEDKTAADVSSPIQISGAKSGTAKKSDTTPSKADDPQFVVLRKATPPSKVVDAGPVPRMTRVAEVKALQEKLVQAKVYAGEPDGKWGHNTIVAMKEFQEQNKLEVTGKPNKETWRKLNEVAIAEWEVVEKNAIAKKQTSDKTESRISITDVKPSAKPKTISKAPLTIAVTQAALTLKNSEAVKEPEVEKVTNSSPAVDSSKAEKLEVSQPAPIAAPPSPETVKSIEPPSLSGLPQPHQGGDVVVKLNADAGVAKDAILATPAAVSEIATASADTLVLENPMQPTLLPVDPPLAQTGTAPVEEAGDITVRAPKRDIASAPTASSPLPASTPTVAAPVAVSTQALDDSELPPAASKAAAARLEKELAEAQARVAMVSNDPRYELEKYAPKALESVNGLVDKVKRDVSGSVPDSDSARSNLRMIDEELEKAKQQCLKQKAEQKVAQVDAIYTEVKQRFGKEIGKTGKGKATESSARLADLMGKIDTGYSAMLADFKKGNYDPIVERCDGFKLQIEILGNEAAKSYLETTLEKSKGKLSRETLAEIEDLRGQNKYMEAVTLLDSVAKAKSASTASKRKS